MKTHQSACRAVCAAAVALFGVSACRYQGVYVRLEDHAKTIPPSNGVLVFSTIKANERSIAWDYAVKASSTGEVGALGREFRLPKGFYDLPCARLGNLIAASLAPGEYEFGPWELHVTVATGARGIVVQATHDAQGPAEAHFRFSIRPGQLTYIGEMRVDESAAYAQVADNWRCDEPYVNSVWPALQAWPVVKNIGSFPPGASAITK